MQAKAFVPTSSPPRCNLAVARLLIFAAMFLLAGFHLLLLSKFDYPRSWYDHQRLMQLAALTLSAVFLPFAPARGTPSVFKAIAVSVAVLLAVLCVHGLQWRPVLIESLTLALLVIVATWWGGLIRTWRLSDALLLSAHLAISWYVALSFLWLGLSLAHGVPPNPFTFFDGFINPRFFGAWITLSWPLLLVRPRLFQGSGIRHARLLSAALFMLAGLWWSLAIFSGTRATWLAAAVMLVLAAFCSRSARCLVLRGVLVIATGCVLHQLLFVQIPLWATGLEPVNAFARLREGGSLSQRDVLWGLAWQGISERPWFGAGPMMFSAIPNGVASTTHNIVLQLAHEWGVPFALLVVAVSLRALWRQFLRCRAGDDPIRLVLWMGLVGALIEAQFDGLLSAPHSQLLFTVLCAWLVSLDEPATAKLSARRANAWKVLRFAPLLLALALWSAVWPELSRLDEWELEAWKKTGVGHFQPRYWLQGVIFPDS